MFPYLFILAVIQALEVALFLCPSARFVRDPALSLVRPALQLDPTRASLASASASSPPRLSVCPSGALPPLASPVACRPAEECARAAASRSRSAARKSIAEARPQRRMSNVHAPATGSHAEVRRRCGSRREASLLPLSTGLALSAALICCSFTACALLSSSCQATKHADTTKHVTQKSFKTDRRDKPKHSGKSDQERTTLA